MTTARKIMTLAAPLPLRRGGVLKARHEARLGEKLKAAAVAVPSDSAPQG